MRVAYIIDIYPKVSLTFIDLEIKKLRNLGMQLNLYAIWRSRQETISKDSKSLIKEMKYLSASPIRQHLKAHCYYAWKVTGRYLEILKLCLFRHPNVRLRGRTLYNFLLAPYLAASLEKKHISHIHAHFAFGAATMAMMASELLKISFSFTAHGTDLLIEKVLLNEKIKRSKFVISISEYNRECLLREVPKAESRKIKTIHCGVDPNIFLPCNRMSHQDRPVLLAVGNLVWQKGHKYLIEACRYLKSKLINYRCIIVGEGPKRKELESLIHRYNMKGEIELPGSVPYEYIQEYYDKADFVVHPSISEGIPVVLMEAMSNELPVIATHITGVQELINNEENGILVSPGDDVELAEAMMRLLNNRELRIRLGKNARNKILRDFHIDINIMKIKKLFDSELITGQPEDADVKL